MHKFQAERFMPSLNTREMTLVAKDKKLRGLILYISEKSAGDASFGAVKLNKLLFYADFLAYLNFGEPITGQDYFKLQNGPAPKRLLHVRRHMEQNGDIQIQQTEFYGLPQEKVIPLKRIGFDEFEAKETALVDKIIAIHWGKTASEISDESHGFIGWRLAKDKEIIPYQVARLLQRPLTQNELKHAKPFEKRALELSKQVA
jgi:hypothetical protein